MWRVEAMGPSLLASLIEGCVNSDDLSRSYTLWKKVLNFYEVQYSYLGARTLGTFIYHFTGDSHLNKLLWLSWEKLKVTSCDSWMYCSVFVIENSKGYLKPLFMTEVGLVTFGCYCSNITLEQRQCLHHPHLNTQPEITFRKYINTYENTPQ